ncbi:MAG: hypothetical protein KJO91_13425, partial [Gammaproteobacteria bacterium]|nr:hypothetical protein [Gammaproteobacteria bacterium]
PEVDKTLTFIRNQQQMEDTDAINVHILGSAAQIDSLEATFVSGQANQFHIHRLKDVSKKLGINGLPDRFADGLFAWIAANKFGTICHYGSKNEFNRFYYSLASKALYAASVIVVIASLLITESNISKGISYKESTALLNIRTNEFMRVYKDKYQEYEGLFANANLMDLAVGLVDRIEENSSVSPLDFMIALSKAIGSDQSTNIYIDKIEWTTRQVDDKKQRRSRRTSQSAIVYGRTDLTSTNEVQHIAVVTGRIRIASSKYRDSVDQIDNIITLLNSSERIVEVSAIDLPVEVRPEKKFASESKAITSSKNSTQGIRYGLFSLQVVMKAPEHV